jgi:hypothetical protein
MKLSVVVARSCPRRPSRVSRPAGGVACTYVATSSETRAYRYQCSKVKEVTYVEPMRSLKFIFAHSSELCLSHCGLSDVGESTFYRVPLIVNAQNGCHLRMKWGLLRLRSFTIPLPFDVMFRFCEPSRCRPSRQHDRATALMTQAAIAVRRRQWTSSLYWRARFPLT